MIVNHHNLMNIFTMMIVFTIVGNYSNVLGSINKDNSNFGFLDNRIYYSINNKILVLLCRIEIEERN